jgi:antitoxin (DNA-binding transcriptional repressor) of toxin-antitoxin stability system
MLNFTFMKEVTMLAFRRNAKGVLAAVKRGEHFVLTHRGRAVARLEPVRSAPEGPLHHDALYRIADFAVDGPGGKLDNATIDATVYG